MATREISVPDIGDFKEVDVIEVLVKAGDVVQPEQSLITVESDKATMEIPSPAAGVVKEMRIKPGDKVSKGSLILLLDAAAGAPAAAPKKAPEPTVAAPVSPAPARATVAAPVVPIGKPAPVPAEPPSTPGLD
jgi:pyruvate dehydrogenase E2 component (dihydrolipoamide acetyltransferase)